jgi:iron complex outermembrane recepter protein
MLRGSGRLYNVIGSPADLAGPDPILRIRAAFGGAALKHKKSDRGNCMSVGAKWSRSGMMTSQIAISTSLAISAAALVALSGSAANAQAAGATSGTPSSSSAPAAAPAAQQGSAPAAAPSEVNEIVVTATKRSETVQRTPLSISAYSGAQLAAQGITSVTDVGYITPGVSERNSGPGQTEYEMRGIASSGGQSPTVGFYLDETPLTPPTDAQLGKVVVDPDLYDISRVEVLRGPQGTLYGSGSMGGTIKVVTNQPEFNVLDGSLEALGSGTQNGGGNYTFNGMLNVPLVDDKVALRVVGTDKYVDGWIDRVVLPDFPLESNDGMTRGDVLNSPVGHDYRDVNYERLQGLRASLKIQPTDELTITPSVFYQGIHQGGPNWADNPPGPSLEAHYQPYDIAEPSSDDFMLYSLVVKYRFPDFDVTSATSHYVRHSNMQQDSTEPAQNFFETVIGIPDLPYSQIGPLVTTAEDYSRQTSEEIRLTSNGSGPFQWIVGAFYEDLQSIDNIFTNTPGPIVQEVLGVPSLYTVSVNTDYKQYAGFGEASYKFLDVFKATVGLRYYSYNSTENLSQAGGLPDGSLTPQVFKLPASASGFNPKFNLAYIPNDYLTVYAQASKGFRPGGANTPAPYGCQANPLQYQPDGLWSYELGEKARLFGNRVTVNAAGYYEDWSNIQQMVAPPCGATYTANAGSAQVYGGELEVSAKLTPELTLTNSAGYTHAEIASTVPGSAFTVGERVQDVPDWTNSTTLVYRRPINDDYTFIASAANQYIGSMLDVSYGVNNVPSHDIVNLRATVEHGPISVALFINNASDVRAILGNTNALSFNVPTFNRVSTNQPRTIGLDVNYRFGGK